MAGKFELYQDGRASTADGLDRGVREGSAVSRFSERLNRPDVAWDLFADLEPVLRAADGFDSVAIEVLDSTGAYASPDIASARAGLAERAATPIRITSDHEGRAADEPCPSTAFPVRAGDRVDRRRARVPAGGRHPRLGDWFFTR